MREIKFILATNSTGMGKMLTTITLAVCASWLLFWSLIQHTKNSISLMLYKIIPFFISLACVIAFLSRIGVLSDI